MKKKQEDLRTKKRSDIRLMLGGWYYTWRRYIGWYTSKRQFASGHGSEDYPNVCFQHKSLLKRNLTKEEEVYQENKIVNLRLAVAARYHRLSAGNAELLENNRETVGIQGL